MADSKRTGGRRAQAAPDPAPQSTQRRSRRKEEKKGGFGRFIGRFFLAIFTLCLVGVLTAAIFVAIFMRYVDNNLRGHVEVDVSAYNPSVSSELYYNDPTNPDADADGWVMYDTLFLKAENRIWVTLDEIPEDLQKAFVAVEDKRFKTHHGVDWHGIVRAIKSTLTGGDVQGGSSITQQMIKNVTGDNQNTVKRKVVEIYRALAFEKTHSKEEVMEIYLNYIYMGESCYGVKTAAKMYFGKDVSELDLAECASLAGITNNPSMYDPFISDWTREKNRERQEWVLKKMLEQEMITEGVYNAALNEEVIFSNGYNIFGEYTLDRPAEPGEGGEENPENPETPETPEEPVTRAHNSYYTDQVIEDVIADLMDKYGYDRKTAENKVFSGVKIYTAQNINFQHICEDVFENTAYQQILGEQYGDPLQAAITLMDPYTGAVLAMVGGTGVKQADRGWNWATAPRQCGSSIKPISTYAPALDDGTITAASTMDDYPLLMNGEAYPRNAMRGMGGMTSCMTALYRSLNIVAVRVNLAYGTTRSYNFMVEKLGFEHLDPDYDGTQVGNMALGGLHRGVTTEEMCAAYCPFVNDGLYTKPYTYYKVTDAEGKVLLENVPEYTVAFKETTVYTIRETLKQVVATGTGYEARFSGMSMAGKTGTTNDEYDRYFVGFTPYYCAAVWTGFAKNQTIHVSGNPSSNLWHDVMVRIHEGLEDPGFHDEPSGMKWVTVCADSGLLATDACKHDMRGSRVKNVLVAADTAPTESCRMHVEVDYCKDGKHIATEFCPEESIQKVSVLNVERELIKEMRPDDHKYTLQYLSGKTGEIPEICPVHDTEPTPEPDPEDPTPGPGGEDPTPGPGGEDPTPPAPGPGGDEPTPPAPGPGGDAGIDDPITPPHEDG